MNGFAALNEVDKIERRRMKEKKRAAAQQEKLARDAEFGTESVKNRSWAEIDSDEEQAPVAVSDTESDEESRAPSSPARSPARNARSPPATNGNLMPPKAKDATRPLSKKEKAAQKQKELDNLDDVLAEFGLDVSAPNATAGKKKKKKEKAVEETGDAVPAPAAPAPAEVEQELDEDTKQAALKALREKAGKKGNKGGKSAAATAAAEAKKRVANNKPKRDKMQYDR